MDRSEFGFTTPEALDLVTQLLAHPGFAESIKLEPRLPSPVESELAWRISCVLRGGDVFTEVAELQRTASVGAVLNGDRVVVFRRVDGE